MPITAEEKTTLDAVLATIEPLDHVAITRLLYATLIDAKLGPHNPNGMGWKAISSLARMAQEKTPWDTFRQIEASIEAPIRLPLIKSCDTIFRGEFANNLSKLDEDSKQLIAFVLGKMDDVELVALTKVLYEIISLTQFPDANAQAAFGKFYWAGYTWAEMQNTPDVLKNVLLPIVNSCSENFARLFSESFQIEAPPAEAPSDVPAGEATAEASATATDDELSAAIAEMEKEMQAASTDPTAVETKTEPVAAGAGESEDEGPTGDPNAPMPAPEFGTPEEVEARAKADEEKPKFKGGKKKKKVKNGLTENGVAETEASSESAEAAETSSEESDAQTAVDMAELVDINEAGETIADSENGIAEDAPTASVVKMDLVSAYPAELTQNKEPAEKQEPTP